MSSSTVINQLLQNNGIWQASEKGILRPALSTGYANLDKKLHYSGWPQGAVSELLLSTNGIGEIRLLTPLLSKLCQQAGYIVWINPPYLPYGPALSQQKVALDKLIIIKTTSTTESVWAAQQAMTSKSCSAVLLWLPPKTLANEIRKLSIAAKAGNCWGVIFRSQQFHQQPSAATLRITMQVEQQKHQLSIIKQPGGWSGQQLSLDLFPERINWNPLAACHWPVFLPNKPKTLISSNTKVSNELFKDSTDDRFQTTLSPSYH